MYHFVCFKWLIITNLRLSFFFFFEEEFEVIIIVKNIHFTVRTKLGWFGPKGCFFLYVVAHNSDTGCPWYSENQ